MSKPKLALIPSGYKSGKVYSILPNDATGDFDFERQSIGTRVRKDGLIEEAKTVGSITNDFLYSEDYSQSQWSKGNLTVTTDQELAPDGTNTADEIFETSATSNKNINQLTSVTAGKRYTTSFFVKYNNIQYLQLTGSTGFPTSAVNFDIQNKTIVYNPTNAEARIDELANDWVRISLTLLCSTTINGRMLIATINSATASRLPSYTGNTSNSFYLWGGMMSEGALSDYIKTEGTTETKTVETFTDVPRLDWLNSNCPSLLLEPQRTNLQVYSEQFDNSAWSKTRCTITSNQIVAPNGELSGDKAECNTTGSSTALIDAFTITSGDKVSFSVFVKKGNTQHCSMGLLDSGYASGYRIIFDLDNKVVTYELVNGTNFTNTSYTIKEYGNGWFRLCVSMDTTGTTTARTYVYPVTNGGTTFASTEGQFNYVWGAQGEIGGYCSSYIKTEASAVTRLKDDCHLLNHTLFTDYPFTVYAKAKIEDVGNTIFSIYGGASNKYLAFLLPSSGVTAAVYRRDATNNDSDFYNFSYSVGDTIKVALAFINDTTYKLYINGTEIADVTSGLSVPFDNDDILLGQFRISGDDGRRNSIDDFRVYDYTLTDAELTELTTL